MRKKLRRGNFRTAILKDSRDLSGLTRTDCQIDCYTGLNSIGTDLAKVSSLPYPLALLSTWGVSLFMVWLISGKEI
jgi:hypothetical protein